MIHMFVVSAMVRAPTESGTFEGCRAEKQRVEPNNWACLEGQVGKKPVIAQRDAHRRGDREEKE
jgi:hypothetical protein